MICQTVIATAERRIGPFLRFAIDRRTWVLSMEIMIVQKTKITIETCSEYAAQLTSS